MNEIEWINNHKYFRLVHDNNGEFRVERYFNLGRGYDGWTQWKESDLNPDCSDTFDDPRDAIGEVHGNVNNQAQWLMCQGSKFCTLVIPRRK